MTSKDDMIEALRKSIEASCACFEETQAAATRAYSALEALNVVDTGWMPIETAPRDGDAVLLWKGDEPRCGEYTIVAYWSDGGGSLADGWYACAGSGGGSNSPQGWHSSVTGTPQGYPTHWRPLPTPPDGGREP